MCLDILDLAAVQFVRCILWEYWIRRPIHIDDFLMWWKRLLPLLIIFLKIRQMAALSGYNTRRILAWKMERPCILPCIRLNISVLKVDDETFCLVQQRKKMQTKYRMAFHWKRNAQCHGISLACVACIIISHQFIRIISTIQFKIPYTVHAAYAIIYYGLLLCVCDFIFIGCCWCCWCCCLLNKNNRWRINDPFCYETIRKRSLHRKY